MRGLDFTAIRQCYSEGGMGELLVCAGTGRMKKVASGATINDSNIISRDGTSECSLWRELIHNHARSSW
jgi:hypothetical protein